MTATLLSCRGRARVRCLINALVHAHKVSIIVEDDVGTGTMKPLMAVVVMLGSSAGLAQIAAPSIPTEVTASPAKAKPPKSICRSANTTGSMFPTRTCHSKEEWSAIDAANAANTERMSNARKGTGRN